MPFTKNQPQNIILGGDILLTLILVSTWMDFNAFLGPMMWHYTCCVNCVTQAYSAWPPFP